MLDLDLTLKNNELFLVGRSEERGGMREAGLYLRDTRFLSMFATTIGRVPLETLSVQTLSASEAIVTSTTQPGHERVTGIPGSGLVVRQRITLDAALNVTIEVRAFGGWASTETLEIRVAADFRDMFDVRGMTPKQQPTLDDPQFGPDQPVTLSATGSDGQTARLEVTFDQESQFAPIMGTTTNAPSDNALALTLSFSLDLSRGKAGTVISRFSRYRSDPPTNPTRGSSPG